MQEIINVFLKRIPKIAIIFALLPFAGVLIKWLMKSYWRYR